MRTHYPKEWLWNSKFNKKGIFRFGILTFVVLLLLFINIQFTSFNSNVSAESSDQPEIKYMAVETTIDNNYAMTEIYELFHNPYDYPIDDTFTIEIPEKAFISNFSLTLDNETYYAKIVPKEVGEKKYQEAVINGSDAGLMVATSKNLFSYSISLSPYQDIIVGLRYEQFIEKSLGGYEYILPLSGGDTNREIGDFTLSITLKANLFVNDITLDNYRDDSKIAYYSANEARVFFQSSQSIPEDDFIMKYELAAPPINGTLLNYNDGDEEYFFHIFSPQRSDLGGKQMDKEIIFVLDKSGSMSGRKIEQLKTAFKEIINQLPERDTFNIVMFDTYVKQYKGELIGASEENRSDAVDYISSVAAGGSTNFNGAILTALDMFKISETKVPIIVMLSDGLPTEGVTNLEAIRENVKKENTAGVAVFSLGFGDDVDFEFLKALSLENYGIAIRIYERDDASEQITDFYDTISTPLLKGLTFEYSEGAYEVYPGKKDQLFEGTEIIIVGKYDGESRKITSNVEATSWDGMRAFSETFELKDDTGHEFIPRLWAYEKIQYLLDVITVEGENESLVENVTDLALKYSFVTPYTSLLVEVKDDEDQQDDVQNDPYADSDCDGLPDQWELYYGLDPNDPNDANMDRDGDGYSNRDEYQYGTDPSNCPSIPGGSDKKPAPIGKPEASEIYGFSHSCPIIFIIMIISVIILSAFIYTRIKKHKLLEQKRREHIYNYIKANPGEHFRGIQKALNLEIGVVAHHVNILEREDLIKSRQDGMYRRFYPMDSKIDVELILSKIQEQILSWIKTNPGTTQSRISTTLGINKKVVNYHIKILQDAGFIFTEKDGRESLCYSIEPV